MKKFWMIVRADKPTNTVAETKYCTLQEAMDRAERYCQNSHIPYVILETILCCEVTKPPIMWMDIPNGS
jgi:hypothetical protein